MCSVVLKRGYMMDELLKGLRLNIGYWLEFKQLKMFIGCNFRQDALRSLINRKLK